MAATFLSGTGNPNGVVFGNPGDAYFDLTGGPPTFWAKQSGVGTNTGWVALTSGGVLQALASDVTAPTAVAAGGFAAIPGFPPVVITIGAGSVLLVHFSVSGFQNAAGNSTFFRLRVNGTTFKGTAFSRPSGGGPNGTASAAIVARIPGLGAGTHTVDIQGNSTGGTTTIDPTIPPGPNADSQHATLLVEEFSV